MSRRGLQFSERELVVLRRIAAEHTYAAIAYELGLSLETIKTCVARLRAKLGCTTKVGLALWVAKHLSSEETSCL